MRGLDITKKDGGENWWDKYNPAELLKNLTKQEEKVYKDIPYVQGVNDTIPALPNYEGLIDSPTAQKFFELVKDKNYDLGAKGIANWTNANGKHKTNIDSIDCSGAVCVVKNAMGADYHLTNTGAAKFKSVAKTKGIKPEESVDGDMIVFQTKGGNTDHIGFIVVDDQGRRYIAESSSSYNGTTITPYEERVKDLESRLPNLTYDIVSDNENRPTPKPYNTSYEHLTNDKIEVRPPSKVLDKAKEAAKQGAIPTNAVKVEKPIVSGNSWGDRFVDRIKEAGSEIAETAATESELANDFNTLQKKHSNGKLSKDGNSYELEGNIFNKDGSLVLKNGRKGKWQDWGHKYWIEAYGPNGEYTFASDYEGEKLGMDGSLSYALASVNKGIDKEAKEQTPEDKIADYEKEVSQDEETLKRYKENPIAFLEDDIRGWESEPDSDKKTESLKNLKENLEFLKSDSKTEIDPDIDATSKAGDDTEVATDDTDGVGGAELTEELKGGITDENKQKVIDALDSIPSWMKNAISEDPKVLDDPTFLETLEGTSAGSILQFFTKGLTGYDIFNLNKKDVDDKSQDVPNWMKSIGEKFTSSFAKTTGLGLGDTAKKIATSGIVDKPKSALADEETVAEEVDYSSPDYINDLPDENGVVGGAGGVATIDDFDADKLKQQIADNKELLNNLNNRQPFEYESQTQWNNDLAGTIADASRGIVGMIGASEPLPKYSRSEMFKTSMGELTDRRNMGLSDDEIGFAKQMAERGYGYDVKNIRRMAGGSAGVALGNLGRAQGQLYDRYGQLAARDEAVRRQNRADFNRGALQEERVNRMIFEDDLRQAERSKAAAAQLTSESMQNIRDRNQYNRVFGPGSQMYQYMEDVLRDKESSIFYREQANADRELEAKQELERKIAADEKSLFERTGGLNDGVTLGGEDIMTVEDGLKKLNLTQELFDSLDDNSKKQVYDRLSAMGIGKPK